ncbi:hypothetical protein EJ06DRAFT_341712 [Trichodelitschia bisporula]|uniref:Uncharacterized protein n=1 Tax=Trichodelitschia bisporula TaxID=703511 RepID=A0A6G1I2J8_9PEZI|nr:hypothetical protein EJ06DRAFT_341712 [Trichodelitschia bisporula]
MQFLVLLTVAFASLVFAQHNHSTAITGYVYGPVLLPANIQDASRKTGFNGTAPANTMPSLTDNWNFINYCTGKVHTNGAQNRNGSCNGIVMGDLPAASQMVSTIITSPLPGENLPVNTSLAIRLRVANLAPGHFAAPGSTYFSAPQQLDSAGCVRGHVHVTLQDLGGSFTPSAPLDAQKVVFFQGVNDAGDGSGGLVAPLPKGLPRGFYRVCTMVAAGNHQPVVMPVAQRGAQDDCTKFSVGV